MQSTVSTRARISDVKALSYFEDGTRLFRVVDAGQGQVCVEDCRHPDDQPWWEPIHEFLARNVRVVRPLANPSVGDPG